MLSSVACTRHREQSEKTCTPANNAPPCQSGLLERTLWVGGILSQRCYDVMTEKRRPVLQPGPWQVKTTACSSFSTPVAVEDSASYKRRPWALLCVLPGPGVPNDCGCPLRFFADSPLFFAKKGSKIFFRLQRAMLCTFVAWPVGPPGICGIASFRRALSIGAFSARLAIFW